MRRATPRIVEIVCTVVVLGGVSGCSDSESAPNSDPALVRDRSAAIRPNATECPQSGDGIRSSYFGCGPGLPCQQAQHLDDLSNIKSDRPYYLARQTPFSDAWTCQSALPPTVMYGEVQVSYGKGARGLDARKHFETLRESTDHGEVRQIQGRSAWVGSGDEGRETFTSVEFLVDETFVVLLAQPEVPLDEVIRVANSLDLASPRGA